MVFSSVCVCVCGCILQVLRAELELTRGKMEEVRALAQELMSARGENCQAQVRPKVEQLNQRYETIAQRITCGLVGKTLVVKWSAIIKHSVALISQLDAPHLAHFCSV